MAGFLFRDAHAPGDSWFREAVTPNSQGCAICKMFLGSVNGRREVRLFGAERMKGLAETDALTRLANCRSFDEALLQEFEKAKKSRATIGSPSDRC